MSARPPTLLQCTIGGRSLSWSLDAEETKEDVATLLARRGHPLNQSCGGLGQCSGCIVETSARFPSGEVEAAGSTDMRACLLHVPPGETLRVLVPERSRLVHRPLVVDAFHAAPPVVRTPLFPPTERGLSLAIDIGTTTIAALLVRMSDGEILAKAGEFNRQIRHGDDVVTRINACAQDRHALLRLQTAVVESLCSLARELCLRASVKPEDIAGATVAGNTTMLHLLAGEDPTPLGVAPFQARFLDHRVLTADALGWSSQLPGSAGWSVHLLPGLSAYVGADLSAGIFATGLASAAAPTLLVDVGTNGEIVLCHEGRLFACATAAGPAFEGCGLTHGTRAADGAIRSLRLDPATLVPAVEIIGGADMAPHGLCGTAYVDFLAEGRRAGLLTETGRFSAAALAAHPGRFRPGPRGAEFVVHESAGRVLTISGVDVALLLQAKAAIAAGITTLLSRVELVPSAVDKVYLAGGFGLHLDVGQAIACGLLPGFAADQVEVVGNTSLAGAYLALLDAAALPAMSGLRGNCTILELNQDPGFEDAFIDNLLLPEPVFPISQTATT